MTRSEPHPQRCDPTAEAIMKLCMQTNRYGENTGRGFTGAPISKCRECTARKYCDKETWMRLGGAP
jgi:hypothetical protein